MKKKTKISKKIVSSIMVFITIVTTILTSSVSAYASELDMSEQTGFNYLGISPITGRKINHNIYRMKMDNKIVFCVEPGIKTSSGGGYISEELGDKFISTTIIREMQLESNNTGTDILLEENTLKITANKNSNSGVISYIKIPKNEVGTSIVYCKHNYQSLSEFHMESSMSANLNINVIKLGIVKVKKIDEGTGKELA
ncbi:hypothetical protein GSQ22_12060, partial [Clostridioides difficile]|nr:hypothetical protein [Clostridioides difficile]